MSIATIAIFARAPLPGKTKSRLIPRLGPWGAARLHLRLLERSLRIALETGLPVELHGVPRRSRTLVRLASRHRVPLVTQRGDDLGERMYNALSTGLRRRRAFILVGSDIPALRSADLKKAARLLAGGCDAVLSPAEDGGYALIGARRVSPLLFRGIEWGAADVYRRTTVVLDRIGFHWRALPPVWDIDRPDDLERFRRIRWRRSFSAARRGVPR